MHKIKQYSLSYYFTIELVKNVNLIPKFKKLYLFDKNQIQIKNKIFRRIKTQKKTNFISGIKAISINIFILNLFIRTILNMSNIRNKSSFITLKINGPGNKKIIYSSACGQKYSMPDELYINGAKNSKVVYNYKFKEKENEVKLIWNGIVSNCDCLFFGCKDIIEIDLSHLDTKQITSMSGMFYECNSLTYVNLSYINTSRVKKMNYMFYNCFFLNSIDL